MPILELLALYQPEENSSTKYKRFNETTLSGIIAWEERLYPES
jgi:hypothetical protein